MINRLPVNGSKHVQAVLPALVVRFSSPNRERASIKVSQEYRSQQAWMVSDETHNGKSDYSLIVSSTTNYDRFRLDPSNRYIRQKHVDELAAAISEKNLLREYPIVVDSSYTVLDGQHRLSAARKLGVPIYYIVSKNAEITDIASTTAMVASWSKKDYFDYWCKMGKKDYLALRDFMNDYPFLSLWMAQRLTGSIGNSKTKDCFQDGGFRMEAEPFARKVAQYLSDFSRHTKLYTTQAFIMAISNLADNPNYDHKRMMRKMEYLSTKLVKCPDAASYISVLNGIYNYKDRNVTELKSLSSYDNGRIGRKQPDNNS